ncbi:MAG TPA: SIS domain-containing protein, partial [Candidatus Sulfotelmatobacter sp.]|nr:SIS domain-containing protein [Candidatus Sulfotelmatobacter sp.]
MSPAEPIDGASVLDRPGDLQRLDPADMRGQVGTIPDQLRDGWARTRDLTVPAAYRATTGVAVLGMGGSAIGGDLVHDIFADRLSVPLEVVRGYELPAWVGPKTLVVAASYSGATEETITTLEAALRRRCPVLVVTTGGPLREVARRAELPHLVFPGGGQPRAAVGYGLALLAGLLERTGHLTLAADEVSATAVAAEATLAAIEPGVATEANPAKRLAWEFVDRLPLLIASGAMAAVGRRWKTQLNENGKSDAAYDTLPE